MTFPGLEIRLLLKDLVFQDSENHTFRKLCDIIKRLFSETNKQTNKQNKHLNIHSAES